MKPYYAHDGITIWHGDCLELMPEIISTADVLITDPPYGMRFRSSHGGSFGSCEVVGDDDTSVRDEILRLWEGRPALVFGRWSIPRPSNTRMVLIWDKGEHVGMGDLALPWKPNTEEIYVLGQGFHGHRGSSVLRALAISGTVAFPREFSRGRQGVRHHPTEKPVSLLCQLIAKCPPGTILDPFMGSGTTLRAAKDSRRSAIGIEIEERYCEIAARRMEQEILPFEEDSE